MQKTFCPKDYVFARIRKIDLATRKVRADFIDGICISGMPKVGEPFFMLVPQPDQNGFRIVLTAPINRIVPNGPQCGFSTVNDCAYIFDLLSAEEVTEDLKTLNDIVAQKGAAAFTSVQGRNLDFEK